MQTKILKNLSILISFGLVVKILGLFNRIVLTRILSLEGLSIYAKMMPIANFFALLASFSLGPTITQIVAKNIAQKPYSNRDLMFKGFKMATITASIVSLIHLISNYFITHYLLQMDSLFKPFIFFIPLYYLQSYTGVFKGYFHGHNKMDTYAIGQLIEQVVRIILIYIFITPAIKISLEAGIIACVISLSIGELCQNIYLFFSLARFTKLKGQKHIKADNKAIIKTSINLTSSKLTNAICSFLEPIIFTFAFLKTGMNNEIANELYGIIYGYVIPLIFITNFITTAIETAIIPELVTSHKKHDTASFHNIMNKALLLSFIPASITTTIFFFYSEEMLMLFYHTTLGASYIKLLAIPSFFAYFDGVFISALMSANQEKKLAKTNIITNFIYLLLIYLLVQIPKINILGVIISLSIYLVISPLIFYLQIRKKLNYHLPKKTIIFLSTYFIALYLLYKTQHLLPAIITYLCLIIILIIKNNPSHRCSNNEPA